MKLEVILRNGTLNAKATIDDYPLYESAEVCAFIPEWLSRPGLLNAIDSAIAEAERQAITKIEKSRAANEAARAAQGDR